MNASTDTPKTATPPTFEAVLTHDDLKQIEANHKRSYDVSRRIALAVLTMDSEQLLKALNDDPDTFTIIVEEVQAHLDNLKTALEVSEPALYRLLAVGAYALEVEL